jgi:Domain of unknown function (DUF305)
VKWLPYASVRPAARRLRAAIVIAGMASHAAAQEIAPGSAGVSATGGGTLFPRRKGCLHDQNDGRYGDQAAGDCDRDFVAMIVSHHQGAIDMAQAESSRDHNVQLLRIAHEIIVAQLQEIAAMQLAVGEQISDAAAKVAARPASTAPLPPARSPASPTLEARFLKDNDAAVNRMMQDMSIAPSGYVGHLLDGSIPVVAGQDAEGRSLLRGPRCRRGRTHRCAVRSSTTHMSHRGVERCDLGIALRGGAKGRRTRPGSRRSSSGCRPRQETPRRVPRRSDALCGQVAPVAPRAFRSRCR